MITAVSGESGPGCDRCEGGTILVVGERRSWIEPCPECAPPPSPRPLTRASRAAGLPDRIGVLGVDGLHAEIEALGWAWQMGTAWGDDDYPPAPGQVLGAWVHVFDAEGGHADQHGGEGDNPTAALRVALADALEHDGWRLD